MAKAPTYGNTRIDLAQPAVKPRVTPKPIIDEENAIPDKYQGDIIFNKAIYSRVDFNKKINAEFSELNNEQPLVNVEEFFNLYNEIFFDIPKTGENSHSTIIESSLDYVDDYENPLEVVIRSKDIEIESLNRQLLVIQGELSSLQAATQEEEAQEAAEEAAAQAAQAAYEAEYGTNYVANPLMSYSRLLANLDVMDSRDLLRKSKSKNENDLRQAKEKEDGNVDTKNYNQWNAAIDKRAEGKVKDDLKDLISLTRSSIAAGNGWQI